MIEEFDNPASSSSDCIIVESTKKGYVLKDKKSMMTYLLNLDEYEKIVKQRNSHILKKVIKRKRPEHSRLYRWLR
jgi:hypothetical protein